MGESEAQALFKIACLYYSSGQVAPTKYLNLFLNGLQLDQVVGMVLDIPDQAAGMKEAFDEAASQIIGYLSSSHWDLVFSVLSQFWHSAPVEIKSNMEDFDLTRLLESCHFNRSRLMSSIQGSHLYLDISNCLKIVPKKSFPLLFKTLRNAIWYWIETNTLDFTSLWKRKLNVGSFDVLFEFLLSGSDASKRKAVNYPLMTALLVLSCEDLSSPHPGQGCALKYNFLDQLKKAARSKSVPDVVLWCLVDLQRAATFVPKENAPVLRHLCSSFDIFPYDKVFDPRSLFSREEDSPIDDRVMSDAMVSICQLNGSYMIKNVLGDVLSPNSPMWLKNIFVTSCYRLLSETMPWDPVLDLRVGAAIRAVFMDYTLAKRDKRQERMRFKFKDTLIQDTFRLWRSAPSFLLWVN